jgi:L-ascorbate metabolism protein UlaG (beta-lactamase superfamily)
VKSTNVNGINITWLGHASFMIEAGTIMIYIDPYTIPPNPRKADLVLVTHDHYDHCANIEKLSKDNTVVVGTAACSSKVPGTFKEVAPGSKLEEKGVSIQAVHAYNPSKPFHPKGVGVGYFFTVKGVTIYHAGDTDYISEMNHYPHPDVALLPIGGTYTMDEEQAARACETVKPRIAIPMHYGTLEQTEGDPAHFKSLVAEKSPKTEVRIL